MQPRYKDTYSIDEDIIKEFCEHDVIIGSAYREASLNHFSYPNMYFRTLEESEGEQMGLSIEEMATKPTIVKIMKDAVLVRILEVSSYAKVPENFWVSLKRSWIIPTL